LLAGVIATVYLTVIMPLTDIAGEYADQVDELEFKLQRFRRTAAEKDLWLKRMDAIKHQGEHAERFIAKETAALASADLQTRIKTAVTNAGGELISTQVIPEKKEEQFTRVAVKVRMNGTTVSMREILHAFETGNPYLFVENLNIRPIRVAVPVAPGGKPSNKVVDKLSIDFDVVGYMRAV
jgi:general secretion pathway protein M